ncbi:hypothetical protein C9J85_03370 [Haloferax sp. wsp5]|nr:hypothetical protein C9J85_03370 [Haloferax sp. wsp5]
MTLARPRDGDVFEVSWRAGGGFDITAGPRVMVSTASDVGCGSYAIWKSPDSGKSIQLASWEAP